MSVRSTREQSIAMNALEPLGFKKVPDDKPGGPEQYNITKEALYALEGKTIEVDGDGTSKVL